MSPNHKVAIVTGAGSGIGKATACLFSQRGVKVVLVGRTIEPLEETLSNFSTQQSGLIVQADVSNLSDAKRIVDETLQKFGRLDILVNNAGITGPNKKIPEMSEDEWDKVLDINLKGAFLCSKFAIPAMKKNGHGVITNVSSNWGIVVGEGAAAYCASKGGLILLTKALAVDHAKDGIIVNCICPGDVDTPLMQASLARKSVQERRIRSLKLISPEEIAHAILFLTSEESAMTTATVLVMDNGATSTEGSALLPSKRGRVHSKT